MGAQCILQLDVHVIVGLSTFAQWAYACGAWVDVRQWCVHVVVASCYQGAVLRFTATHVLLDNFLCVQLGIGQNNVNSLIQAG